MLASHSTQYLDNDDDVDDIHDDEEGAAAYSFFDQTQRSVTPTVMFILLLCPAQVFLLLTNGGIIRRVQCRGQAFLLNV